MSLTTEKCSDRSSEPTQAKLGFEPVLSRKICMLQHVAHPSGGSGSDSDPLEELISVTKTTEGSETWIKTGARENSRGGAADGDVHEPLTLLLTYWNPMNTQRSRPTTVRAGWRLAQGPKMVRDHPSSWPCELKTRPSE